jgi:ketosteroid isomerase-like protein
MAIFLTVLLLMQAGSGGPAVSPEIVADRLDARFVQDLHEKKVDDVLTLYTPDAVFVQPDGTEVSGPGLRKLYEQVTAALDSDLHLHRTILKRNVNTVIEDGTYTETLGHRDTGKVDEVKGTYRFTMHRDGDGPWRFLRMEWH